MRRERRTKALAGLDLNGLHDFCAREVEDASDGHGREHCKQLGWRSVAVRINDPENLGDVVAGLQAERSSYGRGVGYGERVGDPHRRLELGDVWRRIENGEWEEPDDEAEVGEDGASPVLLRAVGGEHTRGRHARRHADPTLLRVVDAREAHEEERAGPAPRAEGRPTVDPRPVHPPGLGEALRAGVLAAAPGAQRVALVVSDIPALDETAQTWLLKELARTKLGGCTVDLLWRAVAVVLGALNEKGGRRANSVLEEAAENGSKSIRLAVLIAGMQGVEVQELLLRSWKGRLLPERKGHGTRQPWKGDWTTRCRAVLRQIREENGREAADLILRQTRLVERMAAVDADARRVDDIAVRDDRGLWSRIEIVRPVPAPKEPLPEGVVRIAREAEYVLLWSPAGGTMTRALEHGLAKEGITANKMVSLGSEVAAWGALEATRRLDRGETPYLDYLPQLDLWAVQRDGSENWSTLISADEAVEAGKTDRTPWPIPFSLRAGARKLSSRLRKGNEVRGKYVELKDLPRMDHLVKVYAAQRPASGYATCTVTSESYEPLRRRPIRLRWSDLAASKEGAMVESGVRMS